MIYSIISYIVVGILIGVIFCIKTNKEVGFSKDDLENSLLIMSSIVGMFWPIYFIIRIIGWICKGIYNFIYDLV